MIIKEKKGIFMTKGIKFIFLQKFKYNSNNDGYDACNFFILLYRIYYI